MLRVTPHPLEGIQGATKTPHPRRRSKGATKTPHPLEGIQGTDPQEGPAKKNRKGPKLAISPCGKKLFGPRKVFFFPSWTFSPVVLIIYLTLWKKLFGCRKVLSPSLIFSPGCLVKLFILSCGSWCRSSRIQSCSRRALHLCDNVRDVTTQAQEAQRPIRLRFKNPCERLWIVEKNFRKLKSFFPWGWTLERRPTS